MKFFPFKFLMVALICVLAASPCFAKPVPQTEKDCTAQGGEWFGDVPSGRGRPSGCMIATSDEGKACKDSKECESVCVNGACYGKSQYRGCGIMSGGQVLCLD